MISNKELKELIYYNYTYILFLNYINNTLPHISVLFNYKFNLNNLMLYDLRIIKFIYIKRIFNNNKYILNKKSYLFNRYLFTNNNFIKKSNLKKKINFFFKKTLNNYFFTITFLNYNVLITKSIGHFLKGSLNIKKRRKSNITLKLFIKFFKKFIIKYIKKCIFNKFFFITNKYMISKYIRWIIYTLLFSKLYINELIYLTKKAHNGTRKKKLRKL